MKKVLLLLAMFSVIGLQAQITLTENEMPGIGDGFIQLIDTLPSAGNQQVVFENGANHTWDFSALAVGDTTGFTLIDPAPTPYGSMFPTADLCIQMGDSAWAYFAVDANAAEILGVIGYMDTIEFNMKYSNTDEIYQFPYTMGTSFWDTYGGSVTQYLGFDPGLGFVVDSVRYAETHNESQEVIGWGTVTTALGNFDVLKTQIIDTTYSTVHAYAMMTWIPFSADTSITCRFQWNMRNTGIPLIEAEYEIDPMDSTIYSIGWLMVTPSISIEEFDAIEMSVYPNPTTEVISVELEGFSNFYVRITDAQGRIVTQTGPADGNKTSIPVGELENGLYFVTTILNDQVLGSQTFVKE
ncbi:MAG: hypothetical protein C0592_14295 [Marinilabiliales bacterium]|nr:MAG: hypothetical protein C0592_14295 [Marinilabiliales bacterium]